VIDEQELYGLGDPRRGPDVSVRPVEDVLARGTRLRRRRRTLRTAGATSLVVGFIVAGLIAADLEAGTADDPDVRAGQDRTRTDAIAPPPPPPACADEPPSDPGTVRGVSAPTPLPKEEVPDELRVLPEWTPDNQPVTVAQGNTWTDPCPDTAPFPRDPSLVLVSADANGDGAADAQIRLDGPMPRPLGDGIGLGRTDTELRGGPALLVHSDGIGSLMLAWTDPDGWSWELTGMGGVDEPTLMAVAEALVLTSQPADDEPVAGLDPTMVPAGFRVAQQTIGTPAPVPTSWVKWSVEIGGNPGGNETGIKCYMEVQPVAPGSRLEDRVGVSGTPAEVNGEFALWGSSIAGPGTALYWHPSPSVLATAGCVDWDHPGTTLDQETIVRLAESVVPVTADDPRLPDDPRLTGQG
jgi:hypothetical protein